MNKELKAKIIESLTSVVPITAIVLILSITLTPMPIGTIMLFLVGAFLLIIGMGFFTLGAEIAMLPMGDGIGTKLTKAKRNWLKCIIFLVIGIIITIAEPDLQVLAHQVPAIPDLVIILTVAIGVGVFLAIAMLRTTFKLKLSYMLMGFYIIVFILSIFTPNDFIAVAFDSGGVTTGPITVPFILALGTGMAAVGINKDSKDDSFGLVALCSIGPILAVLLLGIVYNPSTANYTPIEIARIYTTKDVADQFAAGFPTYIKEVAISLFPIIAFFAIFQIFTHQFRRRELIRFCIGMVYTYIGLVMFLTGVNIGFMPAGNYIGEQLALTKYSWILIPIGMIMGYFIVAAEPAVHVLNAQVEEVTAGAIPQSAMKQSLSIGVAISIGIAMLRILTGISIYWFLVPGYAIALILTFFVDPIFTGIAFDSGGVASGPMTATFLLPFAMGACEALGGNILTDAFGIVAMVALTPLITIQFMGLSYKRKTKKMLHADTSEPVLDDEVIDYEDESDN